MSERPAGTAAEAHWTAWRLLGRSGRRWQHTVGVADRATELASRLGLNADVLVAAAWLHDIGYAEAVVVTGFHPLDGARYLAHHGWPRGIVGLVAQHSGALFVANALRLAPALAAYPDEPGLMSEALTYADQTVGPDGERVTWQQRRAEMLRRHGPDSLNAAVDRTRGPYLEAVAQRVEQHLARTGSPSAPGSAGHPGWTGRRHSMIADHPRR
jgi:putative nucleotidyltransferase with HDIG domain